MLKKKKRLHNVTRGERQLEKIENSGDFIHNGYKCTQSNLEFRTVLLSSDLMKFLGSIKMHNGNVYQFE